MGQFESFIGVNFWTALFVLLNTLIIFFVAKKFLFVPVHNIITQRQNEIDGMYSDADRAKSEAQALQSAYESKIADAQATSDRIVLEKQKAINDAKNEISDMALAIAGKVVGRTINDADQSALVDHFIDELGDEA